MMKKIRVDNRGQVLYVVLVGVIFAVMLSMLTMGLTLKNYRISVLRQQHITDYYAADAVAELLYIDEDICDDGETATVTVGKTDVYVQRTENTYVLTTPTVQLTVQISTNDVTYANQFTRWEVRYGTYETEKNEAE